MRAPPVAALTTTATGSAGGALPAPWGPPEPLSTGVAPRSSGGVSITRRAIDHASTSAITTATSTDQLGPPRVPRIEPLAPVASSASKTRRGLIGAWA